MFFYNIVKIKERLKNNKPHNFIEKNSIYNVKKDVKKERFFCYKWCICSGR